MAQTTAVTGQPTRNNRGTILQAGAVADANLAKDLSIRTSTQRDGYGAKVLLSTGTPGSSGNLGTFKPYSAGTFAYQQVAGEYVGKVFGTKVSGASNDILKSGAADFSIRRPIPKLTTTRRYHITAWSYTTGAATKGANAGDEVDFGADHAATPTWSVPGELTYTTGAKLPVNDDYKPKYSP